MKALALPTWQSVASLALLLFALSMTSAAADADWIVLIGDHELDAWRKPTGAWSVAGDARPDPQNPEQLSGVAGRGVIVDDHGRTRNLYSKQDFGDMEAHIEFLIPKDSNSGVKLQGLYELQICDSAASSRKLTGSDCGGVYPRAELLPRYHHLDDGFAPRVNAARPAGEWQTLDLVFHAPRFDGAGKKVANARFVKVVLNGKLVHDNLELPAPTGHAWRLPEVRRGPLMLQADHGPVAFRNIRVKPLD
jgi:3-keto-disaccharide hydrolase